MADEGASPFVEVGPGHALSKLVSRIKGDAQVLRAEDDATYDFLAATVPVGKQADAGGNEEDPATREEVEVAP